jgi:iron(III) transport system substrate-binding protein
MKIRFAIPLISVSVVGLALSAGSPTSAQSKKKPTVTAAPKSGAACKKVGNTAPGLVCTLDGGKTKWVKVASTTLATATTVAAKAETGGKLTVVCVVQEDWCQAMTKAFEKKTGIETKYVRLSSGEAATRLNATKSNPEFDVWFGGPSDSFEAVKSQGVLKNYVSPNAATIPAAYKDSAGAWTGVYIGVLGFCSNLSVLKKLGLERPRSWTALLNPKYKSQFAMAHPSTSGTAYTAVWTQVVLSGSEDGAIEYFKLLNPNVFQYTKSGSAPGQMAGRGEVATALIFSHDCVKFREEGLTELVNSFPSEGTGYEIGSLALLNGAKNEAAGKKFVDWALTPEAQEIGPTVKSYQLPTNPAAKTSPLAVSLSEVQLIDYNDQKAGAAKKGLTQRFDAEVANAPR